MINIRNLSAKLTIESRGMQSKVLLLILLGLVSLAASLVFNGDRALWDTSETRYAEAAREMVSSGDWLIPRIAGQPHLTKPPVTYWLLALSIKMFGLSEGAVRFPVAVACAVSCMITALLGWRLTASFQTGLFAGLLQMISPLVFFGGHVVTTDTFVAMFALLYLSAMWGALTALDLQRAQAFRLLMYLFLSLAFLTKGPPALLPAMAAIVFLVFCNDRQTWKRLVSLPGITLFLAVSASWYLAVLLVVPDALALWKQEAVIKVFVSSNRNMPAYYYPLILLGGALPAVIILARNLLRYFNRRSVAPKVMVGRQRKVVQFLIIWISLPLAVFMVSKTRLILYVLPLIPAINLLAATMSKQSLRQSRQKLRPLSPAWLTICALILCAFITGKYLVAKHGDLSKDMKPVATAIKNDATYHGVDPDLLITMGKMGNGLLYYLQGPPTQRLTAHHTTDASPGKGALLANAFRSPVPNDRSQYVIVPNSELEKYRKKLETYAVPIYFNGQWGVFRRTVNSPVVLQQTHKNRIVSQGPSGISG